MRQGGDHKTRVGPFGQILGLANDASFAAPTLEHFIRTMLIHSDRFAKLAFQGVNSKRFNVLLPARALPLSLCELYKSLRKASAAQ